MLIFIFYAFYIANRDVVRLNGDRNENMYWHGWVFNTLQSLFPKNKLCGQFRQYLQLKNLTLFLEIVV